MSPTKIFFNLFKVRARAVLRRLFLSFVSVTLVVYFHVNLTCFAAKHLKFDRARSRFVSAPVVDMLLISALPS